MNEIETDFQSIYIRHFGLSGLDLVNSEISCEEMHGFCRLSEQAKEDGHNERVMSLQIVL